MIRFTAVERRLTFGFAPLDDDMATALRPTIDVEVKSMQLYSFHHPNHSLRNSGQ